MPYNLEELDLAEISLVDNPANQHAKVVLWKRAGMSSEVEQICDTVKKSYDNPQADFNDALRESMDNEISWKLVGALQESIRASMEDLSGEAREAKIRENVEAFIIASRTYLDGVNKMTDAEKAKLKQYMDDGMDEKDARAAVMRETRKDAGPSGNNDGQKEQQMDVKELEKKLTDLEGQVGELTKANETATAEKDDLLKAVEAAGLKIEKSDDGVKVEKAATPEYVEFNGEKIEKSAVPASILKAIEDSNAKIAKMESEREVEALAKRADAELPNLSGTAVQRGQLLKAVDAIANEADRAAVTEALKAADSAVSKLFETVGKTASQDEDSPEAKLDGLVAKFAS